MAPLSLKIVLDEGAVIRTVAFDTTTRVQEAFDVVMEKLHTGCVGKDYALFLTSTTDDLSGVWLEGHRTLEYYMLRDGDSLHCLDRLKNLRVRMLDGSVKTLQVDTSKKLSDLMITICDKIGITNHDEYGLCREETKAVEEMKPSSIAGTLTLKRKAQQKEKDAKMEQLSKKLKTDDNVSWLDQHKTLREIGLDSMETLLLKRRLFYSDRNVDARDPVQLNLLYVQTRDAILESRHPITEVQAADCKVRWINIRDVHRRMLRKSISNPGLQMKNYKYDHEMVFMRPYYKDVVIPEDFDTFKGEYIEEQEDDQADDNDERDSNSAEFNEYEEKPIIKPKRKRKTSKKKAKNFEEEIEETTFAEATTPSELDPGDPVDAFLLSIGATLKTFSPYHLNLAKSKIFAVVQEHDLQQIVQRQRTGHEVHPADVKVSTSDTDALYLE